MDVPILEVSDDPNPHTTRLQDRMVSCNVSNLPALVPITLMLKGFPFHFSIAILTNLLLVQWTQFGIEDYGYESEDLDDNGVLAAPPTPFICTAEAGVTENKGKRTECRRETRPW
jgi:hypothetical protein